MGKNISPVTQTVFPSLRTIAAGYCRVEGSENLDSNQEGEEEGFSWKHCAIETGIASE